MLGQEKAQRVEIYKDHLAQVLLSKFLSGEITKLEPVYDANSGYRYPVLEKILGDPTTVDDFLKQLVEAGVLKKELFDRTIYCPKCGSARISMHYNCPYCKSFNVDKSSLIEHVPCGYIDTEGHFRVGEKLVCPRCHKELINPDVDYKKAGIWCVCNQCSKSFDIPVPSHFCRDCQFTFTFEDAVYKDVYSYTLSPDAGKEASSSWIMVNPIREFLKSKSFKVETPGFLKGKSGASHAFDVIAFQKEGGKEVIVIDIATATEDEVSEQPVIALFAKIYDVSPDHACLIAVPRINENGKRMAKLYNISLIETKDQNEAIDGLRAVCSKALK
jgi:transcription elongation factor Elf1